MKPTAIKALKLVYVLSFIPLLLVEGYLFDWLRYPPPATATSQFMRVGIFCVVSFFFGIYLGIPHICRRVRAKKTQVSFIYLLGFIILFFITIIHVPNPFDMNIGGFIFNYLHAWFGIDSTTLIIPLGLILSGFFLTKAF